MEYYEMSEMDRIMAELEKAKEASKSSAENTQKSAEAEALDVIDELKRMGDDVTDKGSDDAAATEKTVTQAKQVPAKLVQHTVAGGETLGGIALQYYGSASKDSWMRIYEANKETIGDNPGMIRVGMVLDIPEKEE
jgi:nucleoid-associated protein YgaU